MPETFSTVLPLGTPAPELGLPDVVSGRTITLATFAADRALLVIFICRHCPYVVHVQDALAKLGTDYLGRGVGIVAVGSNDAAAYPEDAPDKLKAMATELGFVFPYCYDETQNVAHAYRAACTPEFFLFDGDRRLAYRGQFDDSRPGRPTPVTGKDLRAAIDAVLEGRPLDPHQRPAIGCSIKWKR